MRFAVPKAAAVLLAAALLATGCGTRASESEVRAGVEAGGVELSLPPAVLDQLNSGAAGATGIGTAPAPDQIGAAAPGSPVAVPGAGPGAAPAPVGTGAAAAAAGSTGTGGAATGSKAGATTTAQGAPCAKAGAPLALGQIGSFSGVFGTITSSARTTAAIWAKHVNARGGLACHPVTVYAVDDGADPSRAAAAVQELVSQKKIVALVAMFAPLSMAAITPVLERNKLPVIGGDSIDPAWFEHPLLFPQGAGIEGIIDGALRQTVGEGKTKLGLLYCVEASLCTAVAKTLPPRAEALGAKMVYTAPVSLTQTDFTAQCQNAKSAGVESFGMGVDGSAIARVARSCAALGYYPQFVSGGGVISPAQSRDPGIRRNTLSTSTPNAPWMLTDTPGLKEYAAALAKFSPGMETDGNSLTAWAGAKLFEAAIGKLGAAVRERPLTSADVLTGLGKITKETLGGLAPPLTFSPNQKAAPQVRCIYFELLTDKGWTAPNGSKFVCS